MSTLCFLGIKLLEAVKGQGLFFVELEFFVARVFLLLLGCRVGVWFVVDLVPKGGVRGVVVLFRVLVLMMVRVVVRKLRLIFGDVGATVETSSLWDRPATWSRSCCWECGGPERYRHRLGSGLPLGEYRCSAPQG